MFHYVSFLLRRGVPPAMSLLPPWTAWGWNVESRQARCAQTKQWLSRFSRSTALAVGWPTADRNVRYDCSRYRETDNAEQDRKMHCTWAEGKRLRWSPARRSGTLSAHVFSRFRLRIRVGLDGERNFLAPLSDLFGVFALVLRTPLYYRPRLRASRNGTSLLPEILAQKDWL